MKIRRAVSLALSIILLIVMGNYLINNLYLVSSTVDSWSKVNAKTVESKAVGSNGVVVSTQKEASLVGLQVLQDGGNAIDAAVAVGYALAVTDPCCGNLGGGGFMLIHLADGTESFINFRETAPLKAHSQMYLDEQGELIENLSTDGYLAVAVPGTGKGLNYALDRYGTMEREQVIEPAIALAEGGFALQSGDVEIFEAGKDRLLQPNVAKIFLQDGKKTHQVGDVLVQTDLANTLKAISQEVF
jgi:gamma-glutamyltranspeptidase / glutathione hydrolase